MIRYLQVVLAVGILAAVGAAVYFSASGNQTSVTLPAPVFDLATSSTSLFVSSSTPRMPPAGYTEYCSGAYKFSLFYPKDLSVTVNGEGGAETLVFQDTATVQGFQIFIVPYSGSQVSEERFKADEPSGVRRDVTYGLVNGASAAAFYSSDPRLGDTY